MTSHHFGIPACVGQRPWKRPALPPSAAATAEARGRLILAAPESEPVGVRDRREILDVQQPQSLRRHLAHPRLGGQNGQAIRGAVDDAAVVAVAGPQRALGVAAGEHLAVNAAEQRGEQRGRGPERDQQRNERCASVVRGLGLPCREQPHLGGVQALDGEANGADIAVRPRFAEHGPRGRQAVVLISGDHARQIVEAPGDGGLEGGQIRPLLGIFTDQAAELGQMVLRDLAQPQVIVPARLRSGEQEVALCQLGARICSIHVGQGLAYFLGVRNPVDGCRVFHAGPVGVGTAEQEQRHGQEETGQDLDLDGGEGGDLCVEAHPRPARRQQNADTEHGEAGGRVDGNRRQPWVPDGHAGVPHIPCNGDDADDDDDDSGGLRRPAQGFAAHAREGKADDDESARTEGRHASGKRDIAGVVVLDQQFIDPELQPEDVFDQCCRADDHCHKREALSQPLESSRHPIRQYEQRRSAKDEADGCVRRHFRGVGQHASQGRQMEHPAGQRRQPGERRDRGCQTGRGSMTARS